MSRRKFRVEKIINMLRQAEILLSQGQSALQACRQLGISEQTYYHWCRGPLVWLLCLNPTGSTVK